MSIFRINTEEILQVLLKFDIAYQQQSGQVPVNEIGIQRRSNLK